MIWFTKHAFARVRERLSIIQEEVSRIIEDGQTVNLGTEPGTTRDHLLFYSQPDNYYFVVVYDRQSSVVVTILPIDFHRAWIISPEAQKEARYKIMGDQKPTAPEPPVTEEQPVTEAVNAATRFRVNVLMWDKAHKWVNCGSHDAAEYGRDIDTFVKWSGLHNYIMRRLDEKGHNDCQEALVVVEFGNKGRKIQRTIQWRRDNA